MAELKLTPMLQQYKALKERYPEALLLFRLGDFYELFGDDALIASKLLELTLTAREIGKGQKLPMCGVPHHAVQRYIAKLLQAGYKAAICDQVEDPRFAKKLVKRDVTRVLTPGTVVEDDILQSGNSNYLASLASDGELAACAFLEVSTGEFSVTRFTGQGALAKAIAELERRSVAELLVEEDPAIGLAIKQLASETNLVVSKLDGAWVLETPREVLLRQLKTASLEGFGLEGEALCQQVAAGLLLYLRRNQLSGLEHVTGLSFYSVGEFMTLDADTRRNLELVEPLFDRGKSLFDVLNQTSTRMGARLLKRWLLEPLLSLEACEQRLGAVESLVNDPASREQLREQLAGLYDLERLTGRVTARTASPRDLVALKLSLQRLPALEALLEPLTSVSDLLALLKSALGEFGPLVEALEKALVEEPPLLITEGGLIKPAYSTELDELRVKSRNAKQWIAELQVRERERTGITTLKVGFNSVFGYYIEITNANRDRVPEDYHRKQTLANAERYITPELKEYEELVLHATERINALEQQLFTDLRELAASEGGALIETARALAGLDVLACFAQNAAERHYIRPALDEGDEIYVKAGRHPVVELTLEAPFVPNDVRLDNEEQQLLILTGPNMAGKSTYLRQVALLVLMAQVGSFVPAEEARIGLVDRIFTRIGARDDLASGRSTFMVEMTETANLLNNATSKSLVVLDEVGRGTSTFDGVALAWAVCEFLHGKNGEGVKTLFATHYHHLNELENLLPRARNYRVEVDERGDSIVFLRNIVAGATDRSYGLQVARLAGLPQEVIERAKHVLWTLEQEHAAPEPSLAAAKEIQLPAQLVLFDVAPDVIGEEVLKLDLDAMTPIEALNTLNQLKQKARRKQAEEKKGGA